MPYESTVTIFKCASTQSAIIFRSWPRSCI